MIVLDIETSGVDFLKCGIWQIGAVDLESGEEFLQEARIDDSDEILNVGVKKPVLEVIGKTEEELRDKSKQTQEQLLDNFFEWSKNRELQNFVCQNPWFDIGFLRLKAGKYGLVMPSNFKAFDLHTLAQLKFFQLNKHFSIDKSKKGSDFGLSKILYFCGLKDKRGFHNALEDCKLTAECFYRLVYGKNFLKEYSDFNVPDYLKRKNDNL